MWVESSEGWKEEGVREPGWLAGTILPAVKKMPPAIV
jgi:hypothetical protein